MAFRESLYIRSVKSALVCVWPSVCTFACTQDRRQELRLVERNHYGVLSTASVTHVSIAPDSVIAFADSGGARVRVSVAGKVLPWSISGDAVGLRVASSSEIEFVDASAKAIVTASMTDGAIVRSLPVNLDGEWESASYANDRWCISSRQADWGVQIQCGNARLRLERAPTDAGPVSVFLMPARGTGLLITSVEPGRPVTAWNYTARADTIIPATFVPQDPTGLWLALPVVPLEAGFVQTITDVRSDRRVHVVYAATGDVESHREVDMPVAFVGSKPEAMEVLAVRVLKGTEVIGYTYGPRR